MAVFKTGVCMDTFESVEAWLSDLGPKSLGVLFFLILVVSVLISRTLSSFCVRSQRARLRDDYEHELRASGQPINQLLLPIPAHTSWNPRH